VDRIRNAIKKAGRWQKAANLGDLETYAETGNAKALARLKRQPYGWWSNSLSDGLPTSGRWTDEDRRFARGVYRLGFGSTLGRWVNDRCAHERPEQDSLAPLRESIVPDEADDAEFGSCLIQHSASFVRDGQPTSAGRFFLGLSAAQLDKVIRGAEKDEHLHDVAELLARFAPDKLEAVVDAVLRPHEYGSQAVYAVLLRADPHKYEPKVLEAYERRKGSAWTRFHEAQPIYESDPARHGDLALQACRAALQATSMNSNHYVVGPWMVERFGAKALPDLIKFFRRQKETSGHEEILDACAKHIGAGAVDLYLTALDHLDADVRVEGLKQLTARGDAAHDDRIHQEIRRGFAETDSKVVMPFLQLAGRWKMERVADDIWELLNHKSKPVREAAARALARAGDAVIPRATELLAAKKADTRLSAITLLGIVGGPQAEAALEARADVEENDDVRDAILLAVQEARERRGIKPTRADIELRVKKAESKAKNPAKWIDLARLPKLKWRDGGGTLAPSQVTYLLFRQSRAKEIVADVEAKPLYDQIDSDSGGEFARAVLQAFLASKQEAGDRWALAVAGLLGDDRVVPLFVKSIREWVESNRGKLAEWAVQALALLGTDSALLAVDALAIRYRNKMKNVGRAAGEAFDAAAKKQGITPEELGDRVVPWLGFEPGKKRLLDAGKSKIEVAIGPDFKFAFMDLEKNKPIKSLPKTVGPELLAEFKDLSANLREVVKAQHLRLENLLVRQRRWPMARWKELFLKHPLLIPFATRLAWGHYDDDNSGKLLATFRALDDLSLTTPTDDEFTLPDTGHIGMLHPLELDEPTRQAWQQHIADYNIEPPFPQMDRRVVTVKPGEGETRLIADYANKELNAMTFRSRAERLGWHRGSVADGGTVTSYRKSFPAAGADILLFIDGLYMGADMYASVTLQHGYFVKSGSVKFGSYTYDEPSNENDERVLRLKDVPPIVYSESMGDLQQIAGTNAAAAGDGAAVAE
jgi:hypothetical protein